MISAALIFTILLFLVSESQSTLRNIGLFPFVLDESWHPASGSESQFCLLPLVTATLATTLGAVGIATPAGISAAVFAHYLAPPILRRVFRTTIELLAGVPSVVYGLWGLTVLVPLVGSWGTPGTNLLSAIVILSLMILPTITLLVYGAFESLPREYWLAAGSLGLSRAGTILWVAVPAARSGIFTAIILGTCRAVGETMAVLMVAGNVVQHPEGLFTPIRTMTANIALEMAYASGDHRGSLFLCGLLLLTIVIALILASEHIGRRSTCA